METQKFINLLNDSSNEESKFVTKNVIDSQTTKGKYKQGDTIKFILVTEEITVNAADNTDVAFKTCASFATCTTKINDIFVN